MFVLDAIYARQSVEKADSLSIQGQIEKCQTQTNEEVKIYRDSGYSAKNTNRPAFQSMMDDVKSGLIRKIVVYRLDRFSRSLADFSQLWTVLQAHDVEFISINETFDTSNPMGRAMLNVIMVFAQLERETTAERVRDNYYQRAKLGSWPGGPAPYGFDIGRTLDATGRLVPTLIPNQQMDVVRDIFDYYSNQEETLGTVARKLNEREIPAPKRAVWENVTLSRILHSPLYAQADESIYLYYKGRGVVLSNPLPDFNGVHGAMLVGKRDRNAKKYTSLANQHLSLANHEAVIASRTWLSCQYKLEKNTQIGGNGRGKNTWLSGLLKCATCGYSIKVGRDKRKFYLTCSGRSNLKICETSISVQLPELEAYIESALDKLLQECPDLPAISQEDTQLTQELLEIERKMERLMDALAQSDDLSMVYINGAVAKLDRARSDLLVKQQEQATKPSRPMTKLRFGTLSFEEKKVVACQFIEKIKLEDERVEVIWKV